MTAHHPSSSVQADLLTLIGLREGGDRAEWSQIRAAQFASAKRLAPWLLVAHVAGAAAVAGLLYGSRPWWMLGLWAGVLIVIAATAMARRFVDAARTGAKAAETQLRKAGLEGLTTGAAWALVPLVLCPDPGVLAGSGVSLVMLIVMTVSAIALAPVALGGFAFVALAGCALAVPLLVAGATAPGIAVALFTPVLAFDCRRRAITLVSLSTATIRLDERDETISLLLREFEDTGADWLWETDAARRVVKANQRFALSCGRDPLAIDGVPLLQILAGPTWETGNFSAGLRRLAEKLKARESFRDLRLPVIVDGNERWWELAASPRYDERGAFAGFRGVGSDVTEQRASADKINRMARFDTLTGLPNRLMVNETLVRAMADAEKWGGRCAFMMIDLDRFKAVNDTLGHPIGDRLLSRVSERLGALMGPATMCGRLGGDEFAIVVKDAIDTGAVETLARTIIDTLSRPYEVDQHTLYIGASVGLAIGPRDGRTAEMLIRSADLALYRAKDGGRGVFCTYEPALHAEAEERRVLEMALRQALEREELSLDYQPVVDARTGDVTGFEALLRWNSREFGTIPPAKFVPLAEEARLIAPIGEWVLRTACEEAARWPSHLRIAVNVSTEQLGNPGFVTAVTSALSANKLSAERLELEVTESVFVHDRPGATQVLERLLDLGVRLSLDDFGKGFSSLGYLSRTRFSSIKVDRSFVQAAAKGTREAIAIIHAVVALARSLGMATTAEGVETAEQHQLIQDLGCTAVQGFYFGRPLAVAEARTIAQRGWQASAA